MSGWCGTGKCSMAKPRSGSGAISSAAARMRSKASRCASRIRASGPKPAARKRQRFHDFVPLLVEGIAHSRAVPVRQPRPGAGGERVGEQSTIRMVPTRDSDVRPALAHPFEQVRVGRVQQSSTAASSPPPSIAHGSAEGPGGQRPRHLPPEQHRRDRPASPASRREGIQRDERLGT